jgi:hypothetical protein
MRAVVLALFLVLASSAEAKAQDWWWQFSYNMGTPAANTRDYISEFSFRGVGFQGRKMMDFQNTWSLGFDLSWQVFNETNTGTTAFNPAGTSLGDDSRSALSGTAFKYINAFPMLASGHYYIGGSRRGETIGWVGLNAGMYYIEERTEAGLWAVTNDAWLFGGAPEVGIAMPAGQTLLTGTVRYNWTAESNGIDVNFWTFAIGIASR